MVPIDVIIFNTLKGPRTTTQHCRYPSEATSCKSSRPFLDRAFGMGALRGARWCRDSVRSRGLGLGVFRVSGFKSSEVIIAFSV